jgi:serine/threonine-protein kinase
VWSAAFGLRSATCGWEEIGEIVTPELAPGTTVAGRYTVLEELGRGGNGSVHRAHDQRLDTDIALKVLFPQLATDPTFIERFRREAQTLARMSHPSILRLFELGEDKELNIYYLVLEHMTGGSLKDRLGPAPWSVEEALEVLRPVGQALDYAHKRQPPVVHRDMKPSNILFNAEGWPVVADFGVARLMQSDGMEKSLTGDLVIGTPAYMAPEQVRGRAEPASDLYAFGVIAYELLAGRVPHRADTLLETLVLVTSTPAPPPTQFNPAIPEPVERVILKMLEQDPTMRYGSAEDFVRMLEVAAQGGEEATATVVTTRPVSSRPGASPHPPTIGTPMPQVRPASGVSRRVIGSGAAAASAPASPEMTVATRPGSTESFARPAQGQPAAAASSATAQPAQAGGIVVGGRPLPLIAIIGGAAAMVLLIAIVGVVFITNQNSSSNDQAPTLPTSVSSAPPPPANVAPGAVVLFNDPLDSIARGRLAKSSTQPTNFFIGYGADGYVIQKLNANYTQPINVTVPGSFNDADLAVDARLINVDPSDFVSLSCRDQSNGSAGYRLNVTPAAGQVSLFRVDGGTASPLKPGVDVAGLKKTTEANHVELICKGPAISAKVNDADVLSVQDSTYPGGGLLIGAGADTGVVEAHFKNLVVIQP